MCATRWPINWPRWQGPFHRARNAVNDGMWYLFACVAMPISASCITPLGFASETQCEAAADRWRRTAALANPKANAQTQCSKIDATTPRPLLMPKVEIPLP